MTQEEGGDDDVYITQKTKKPKLHQEISALGERVNQAVDAMNNVSKAMVDMCKEYQRERALSCRSQFVQWDSKESPDREQGVSRDPCRVPKRDEGYQLAIDRVRQIACQFQYEIGWNWNRRQAGEFEPVRQGTFEVHQ